MIGPIMDLIRAKESLTQIIPLVLISVLLSDNLSLLIFPVILSSMILVAFGFSINDVEDARDDAKNRLKKMRNPISSGRISKSQGYVISLVLVTSSIAISLILNKIMFMAFLASAVILMLYSWRNFRVKSMPIISTLFHGVGMSLITFGAYMALGNDLDMNSILIFSMVTFFSMSMHLVSEIRDFETDRKCGVRTTTISIGKNASKRLIEIMIPMMMISMIVIMYLNTIWTVFVIWTVLFGTISINIMLRLLKSKPNGIQNALFGRGQSYVHLAAIISSVVAILL
jgi:4-hydroxybenzoate polyprenyltransferase